MRRTTVLVALVALARASRAPRLDPDEAMAASRDWSGWPSGRALFARNRRALARLEARLAGGDLLKLCAPPWPAAAPPAAAPRARWVHLPKCGTTFLNTFFNHLCPEARAADGARRGARPLVFHFASLSVALR